MGSTSVSEKAPAEVPAELNSSEQAVLVLSGGLGLGAYHAGAFAALQASERFQVEWIAGSSVGAVTAALIAGARTQPVEALREFWATGDLWSSSFELPGAYGHAKNWLSVLQTRLFGAQGHFRPRFPNPAGPFQSLYDLWPMKSRLERLIDFDRLNSGKLRVSVATTDIETGELVIFDTREGCRIEIDHILASCGYLPEFAPVEIDGRLLGDGGLSANVPIEAIVRDKRKSARPSLLFVIDLFACDGGRPETFEAALARKNDLLFGTQTLRRLEAFIDAGKVGPVVYLRYRPVAEEAGPEKTFDLSRSTIAERWSRGHDDMERAIQLVAAGDLGPVPMIVDAARSDAKHRLLRE
jgi:NTE family protein